MGYIWDIFPRSLRFYNVEVRTSDNVKIRMQGTLFWQVQDGEDPPGPPNSYPLVNIQKAMENHLFNG